MLSRIAARISRPGFSVAANRAMRNALPVQQALLVDDDWWHKVRQNIDIILEELKRGCRTLPELIKLCAGFERPFIAEERRPIVSMAV